MDCEVRCVCKPTGLRNPLFASKCYLILSFSLPFSINMNQRLPVWQHINIGTIDTATKLLDNWEETVSQFIKVIPTEYKKIMKL